MQSLSKRFVLLLFLLILLSLGAHVLTDIQHADGGLQTKWDACLLHAAILLSVVGMIKGSPATTEVPYQIASSRPAPVPLPFRPPIF